MNDADDRVVLVDPDFLPVAGAGRAARCPGLRHIVVLDADTAGTSLPGALAYEELIGGRARRLRRAPSSTSARRAASATPPAPPAGRRASSSTHRSTYLHAMGVSSGAGMAVGPGRLRAAAGADVPRQRLGPGARGGRGRREARPLRRRARAGTVRRPAGSTSDVTIAAGVPTVWIGVADELARRGGRAAARCGTSSAAAASRRARSSSATGATSASRSSRRGA